MKKLYLVLIIILILGTIIFLIHSPEDDWIKDSYGVYIKHGNPSATPNYVAKQQNAIECAKNLYNLEKEKGIEFNSQCLGVCGDYVIDIVNVPRTEEDDKIENQCETYRDGKVSQFIELDKFGEVVRIV